TRCKTVLRRLYIMRPVGPAGCLIPPRAFVARRRALPAIAAVRILICRDSLFASFLTALFPPLLLLGPLPGCEAALLQISPAAMAAISPLKAAHPAECPAIFVARITGAVPTLDAGAAFAGGFAGPLFQRLDRHLYRPAPHINIHGPIIIVNIN